VHLLFVQPEIHRIALLVHGDVVRVGLELVVVRLKLRGFEEEAERRGFGDVDAFRAWARGQRGRGAIRYGMGATGAR
jgi:hypothetical protein